MEISELFGNIPRRRRKRMELYLINDEVNSFKYATEALKSLLPMCNSLRAHQIVLLTDGKGECQIYSGFAPEIYILYANFQKLGFEVQIRQYKTKRK
tara:strand:- start:24584 stop:24874 length:291 start_codon:yes stop_codon:yes gene_type:complete